MTKRTTKPYSYGDDLTAGDPVGAMVMAVLSFTDEAHKMARQAKEWRALRPAKLNKAQRYFIGQAPSRDDLLALESLSNWIAGREPIRFTAREAEYINEILPPIIPSTPRRTFGGAVVLPDGLAEALTRARELVKLKRIVTGSPSRWRPEAEIFKKEQRLAALIAKSKRFMSEVSRYKWLRPHLRKWEFNLMVEDVDEMDPTTCSTAAQSQRAVDFKAGFKCLCERFALRGLTSDLQPIPEAFRILHSDSFVHVLVPTYMEFDWRRNLPADVIRVIHQRGDAGGRIRPMRLSDQERPSGYGDEIDQRLKQRFQELTGELYTDPAKNKGWLLESLNKKFTMSNSQDPESVKRTVRTRLRRLGCKMPKRPKRNT